MVRGGGVSRYDEQGRYKEKLTDMRIQGNFGREKGPLIELGMVHPHRRGTTVSLECKLSMFPCLVPIAFVLSQHNRVNIKSIHANNIYRTHGLNVTERAKGAKRNFN